MADGNGSNPTTLAVPSSIARLNYFYGQLLSQADLKAEQSYHVLLRRLMQRETFGVGTVAGLRVKPGTQEGTILIEPGLALDSFGRELVLGSEQCLEIVPAPLPPAATAPFTAVTITLLADQLADLPPNGFGAPILPADVRALAARLHAAGMAEVPEYASVGDDPVALRAVLNKLTIPAAPVSLAAGQTLAMWLFEAIVGTTYVSLSYLERGADLAPAVLDAACCGDSPCHPTRLREGVTINATAALPAAPTDPYRAALLGLSECFGEPLPPFPDPVEEPVTNDCATCLGDYVLGAWQGLPPADLPCAPAASSPITLAAAYWSRFDRSPPASPGLGRLLGIDNHSFRLLAPSPVVTRALLAAVTQCTSPVAPLPLLARTEPADGARLVRPSGADTLIRACATRFLALPPPAAWRITFYPSTGAAQQWSDGNNPLDVSLEIDAGDAHCVALRVPAESTLDVGTYVWTIDVSDTVRFQARFYIAS